MRGPVGRLLPQQSGDPARPGARTIAFPCISTGAYLHPSAAACSVALRAVREELERHGACDEVIFCTFSEDDFRIYEEAFGRAPVVPASIPAAN